MNDAPGGWASGAFREECLNGTTLDGMFALEQLRADHEPGVLAFERENRDYFAKSISDRGEEFFQRFTEEHRHQLTEQETGSCFYYVLIDSDGQIVGRFNLYELDNRTADVGYRVAEHVAGRGVATFALLELCRVGRDQHQLSKLTAATNTSNVASQKVLVKAGFVMIGPTVVGGGEGFSYALALTR